MADSLNIDKNYYNIFVKRYIDSKRQSEIAEELGLKDKVLNDGWKSLSARETGRIGGLMTKRKREAQKKESEKLAET